MLLNQRQCCEGDETEFCVRVRDGAPLVTSRATGEVLSRREFSHVVKNCGCKNSGMPLAAAQIQPFYQSENEMKKQQAASSISEPEARFRLGGVSASVFVNDATRSDGSTFQTRRVSLQRTFVDSSGAFQTTHTLDVRDLPKAMLALMRAYEHCLTAGASTGDSND